MGDFRISSQYLSNIPVYKHVTNEAYLYFNSNDDCVIDEEVVGKLPRIYADLKEYSIEPPSDGW